ncbi:hypothetical protein AGMMS50268_11050 [Spirochaetia bacterium]|nr:hypothetical protein AGMMS50268_11050 [Spirochaetia bacterium]
MNISPFGKSPFVLTLLKGAAFFSFGICLLSVFLYIAGTRQEFMDSTQLLLIRFSMLGGALSAFLSLYGIIADLCCLFRRRPLCLAYLWGVAGYLFLGSTGGLIVVLGSLISTAAGGNLS